MLIDFRARKFFFPVRLWRLRREFERTQYLRPAEMRAWQDDRLARLVKHAVRHVPYWRGLFRDLGLTADDVRTVDDLAKLPLLTRETIQREGPRLWSERGRQRFTVVSTGGTSGKPISIAMDAGANAQEFVFYWRHWGWSGYRLRSRFVQFGLYFFLNRPGLADRPWVWQPMLGRLLLNVALLRERRVDELAEAIRTYRPPFLQGHAADLSLFALLLKEGGIDDIHFDAVFCSSDMMLPQYRATLAETFGGLVLDHYGHMERVVAVAQCERGGYHVNSDYGILQLEDVRPHGSSGRRMGRVVATSLHNRATPLFRYETGDLIEPLEEPMACPCGRRLPLIKAIQGRQEDVVVTPDGGIVTALWYVWHSIPEAEFGQVEQDGRDHVTAFVVPGRTYDHRAEQRLADTLSHLLGPSMRCDIRHITRNQVKRGPSGKVPLVISDTSLLKAAADRA